VLNPHWSVIQRLPDYTLLGPNPAALGQWLPVAYNQHTTPDWHLEYRLRGHLPGSLRFQLSAPGKEPFCTCTRAVRLPVTWIVRRTGDQLTLNQEPWPLVPGRTLPRDTAWLMGQFEFHSHPGTVLRRRTGHRVRLAAAADDPAYFAGGVYENYERQAATFPKQILASLARHRPLQGRLLDIGCATGLLVDQARAAGLDAQGIDLSSWAVAQANQRTGGRCRVLDLDQATPADFQGHYDFVTLHSVLEHLADPARALHLLRQITRPSGLVYIQTLNADSLMHRLLLQDWCGYTDYTHRSPWITADWLADTAPTTGFEILQLNRYSVWNENVHDDAWRAFAALIQIHPAGLLLQDQFGDFVELFLQPASPEGVSGLNG